jgi:hypothetical protein
MSAFDPRNISVKSRGVSKKRRKSAFIVCDEKEKPERPAAERKR